MTTFEDACRCPRCDKPGEATMAKPLPAGGKMHYIFCRTPLCPWQDTSWMVQVRADGTIPERNPLEKVTDLATPLSADAYAAGRRIMEDIQRRDLRGEI